MEEEERQQVISSTTKAVGLLNGTEKDQLKGVSALKKLTSKKEYVELCGSVWIEKGGAKKCLKYLGECELDEEGVQEIVGEYLKILCNIVRVEKFIGKLVELELVEATLRVMMMCPVREIVMRCVKLVGLISTDSQALKGLLDGNVMSEIINNVSIKDDVFLTSVLPRLLKEEQMATLFVSHGGLSFLQGVLVFEDEASPQAVGGAIAAVGLLARYPKMMQKMIAEEEFVSSFVLVLRNPRVGHRERAHAVRTLCSMASDHTAFEMVMPAVLPLMEMIEDRAPDALPAAVAAFELLGILCSSIEANQQVEEFGGEGFVKYILCFLKSNKIGVVEPLCGLLHVLSFGKHKQLVIDALDDASQSNKDAKCRDVITATLDLIEGGAARQHRKSAIKRQTVLVEQEQDLGEVERPQRRETRESQTARQGAKRNNVLKEILSTERTYTMALFSVVKCFIEPMRNMAKQPKSMVSTADISTMFGNLEEIYQLHKNFLKALDKRVRSGPSPNIADLFLGLADSIVNVYQPYYLSYPKAIVFLDVKQKKVKGFRPMLADLTKKIVRGGMSLENYLIMPIQRVPRYGLLLAELDKATITVHPEKLALGEASKKMTEKIAMLDRGERDSNGNGNHAPTENGVRKDRVSSRPPKKSVPAVPENGTLSRTSSARASRVLSGAARIKQREERETRAASMIFSFPPITSGGESSGDESEIPPPQPAVNPILAEGVLEEEVGGGQGVVRRIILLRDKVTILSYNAHEEFVVALPTTLYSFPLAHLRFERDDRDHAIRLFDTRKDGDVGVLLSAETAPIIDKWVDLLFSAIYA